MEGFVADTGVFLDLADGGGGNGRVRECLGQELNSFLQHITGKCVWVRLTFQALRLHDEMFPSSSSLSGWRQG